MNDSVDLDAYFDRIGWGGGTAPGFETLAGLLRAHTATIPFENLDVLLGRAVRLDLHSLQTKLVNACRGGYCFEQVTLFAAVLERLGFTPVRHSARVLLLKPRNTAPRTHMILTVPLAEGTFVVDPGFGRLAPRIPLPLEDGARVTFEDEMHWMARDGSCWVMRARTEDKTVDAWVSTLEADSPVDFEMANYYTSTHPASAFVNRLMLSAITAEGRVTVMDRELTIRRNGESSASRLESRAALRAVLREYFGFDLLELERLRVPAIPEWS